MIDLEWVKDYIDISDQDLDKLAVKITTAGINIEKVITNHIDNLVIGEVISCCMHPDSDHLHICKVNVGSSVIQIVCGAPNVRAGLKVIVALPGAKLPGDITIKAGKIRGEESNGMICALFELGLEEKTEENYDKGIAELGSDALVGADPLVYLGLDITLYELDIHKHRNNDCYYHIGFAYEIAAILNRKVTLPGNDFKELSDKIDNHFNLEVKTDKCPYFLSRMVTDVKIKESPEFIKKRLLACGMRSINNVVDISNYVMLEYGQPMHFYDKDKLGNKILVRDAKMEEEIVTLDGVGRILDKNDIVITDGTNPVCIAGVMGGADTEVTEDTKNILIESAIFSPVSIRNTASKLNLKSEASIRYGKGLNYEYTNYALDRACSLLEKYADAKILSGIVSYDKIDKKEKKVEFRAVDINKMLGIEISTSDMEIELNRLDFKYELDSDKFIVTIPNRRLDIDPNVNDIAEEIGRLYGYHNLVSTLPVTTIKAGGYKGEVRMRKVISKRLRALGLNEVKTYTLVSPKMSQLFDYEHKNKVVLPNPMSVDKSIVRTTLIPSLINVYEYNKARKVKNINIYEISKTYDANYNEDIKICVLMSGEYISNEWQKNAKVDFYLVKGIMENLLDYLGFKNRYDVVKCDIDNMHPYVCAKVMLDKKEIGIIGKVHPQINKDDIYVLELSMNALMINVKPLKYREANKYPGIEKDLAFIVSNHLEVKDLIKAIKKSGGRLLKDIKVFDVYTGENINNDKKSIAFKLVFEDENRTLTDEEVMTNFNNIIKYVESNFDAELRDK